MKWNSHLAKLKVTFIKVGFVAALLESPPHERSAFVTLVRGIEPVTSDVLTHHQMSVTFLLCSAGVYTRPLLLV